MKIKFVNANVLLFENEQFVLKNKQLLVEDDKIKKISNVIDENADRVIDVENNILMSGFINCHAHNAMTLLRCIKNDVDLQTWLFDYIFPNEEKLTPQDVFYGEMLGIAEGLRAGITCFEESYFFYKEVVDAINKAKVRARVGIGKEKNGKGVLFDLKKALKLFDDKKIIKPVVYPHSIYTVSEEDMETYITFAKQNNLPISTHLAETLKEVGDCIIENKVPPVSYLESLGFFDRKATLDHCVHVDKEDVQILKNYDVNVVTCPSSNLKLASGIAPINTFLVNKINVAIGTDGPASNDTLDMFKEMFLVATLQKASLHESEVVKVDEVLKMATINGAKALGFEKLGKIEEGYYADLILLNTKGLHYAPYNDLKSALVYCAKCQDVYLTMVNGNILFENGKFNIGEDIDEIVLKCQNASKKFFKD